MRGEWKMGVSPCPHPCAPVVDRRDMVGLGCIGVGPIGGLTAFRSERAVCHTALDAGELRRVIVRSERTIAHILALLLELLELPALCSDKRQYRRVWR